MYYSNNNGNGAASAWGFIALFAMPAMGLGLMARQAEAAPFAYVANVINGTVSVIDTATNPPSVVATVSTAERGPIAVAVTPDGKRVYVANYNSKSVSVIDTATNPPSVVATVSTAGRGPIAVAVTPDGKRVYVANRFSNNVSVIDTATNMVVATVPVGVGPFGVAVTPDGKHAYVANEDDNSVSVIDTATNMAAAATIPVGSFPSGSPSPRMGNTPMSRITTSKAFR